MDEGSFDRSLFGNNIDSQNEEFAEVNLCRVSFSMENGGSYTCEYRLMSEYLAQSAGEFLVIHLLK